MHSADNRDEFWQAVALWRSDALTASTPVVGNIDLLLRDFCGSLNQEQRELLEYALQRHKDSIACWQNLVSYLRVRYPFETLDWMPISLSEAVARVTLLLSNVTYIDHIEVILPDSLPLIRGLEWLHIALQQLINPYHMRLTGHTLIPLIHGEYQGDVVNMTITTGQLSSMDFDKAQCEAPFYAGSSLHIASLVIEAHGSTLHVEIGDEQTIFRFALPVWHD